MTFEIEIPGVPKVEPVNKISLMNGLGIAFAKGYKTIYSSNGNQGYDFIPDYNCPILIGYIYGKYFTIDNRTGDTSHLSSTNVPSKYYFATEILPPGSKVTINV